MTLEEKINLADLVLKVIGGLGAALAFGFGYHQYKKGQNWQKAQILLSLIDSFEEDKKIECACQMLDWDEREVQIGDDHKFRFKNEMLIKALRVPVMDRAGSADDDDCFSKEESFVRDCFDAFFDFIHKLYAFRRSGLLNYNDLTYFFYWFELVRTVGKYKDNPAIQSAIENYIKKYKFSGVQELLTEYASNPDPLLLVDEVQGAKKTCT